MKVESRDQMDLINRIVTINDADFDQDANASINKFYLWFTDTLERFEKYKHRIASVATLNNLYKEYFVNSSSHEKCSNLTIGKF